MKHLIICREYPPPPIPAGGIGTYAYHISRLLAECGETVHVIAQLWKGAPKKVEEMCYGRLIIHRVPIDNLGFFLGKNQISDTEYKELKGLYQSEFPPQCFSLQASLLTEILIKEEGIDLIEGQEYEAPLYYLQIRRALGLGPKRKPPCLVHLHSPTEFIALHNEWDINHPYFQTSKRLEDYSIATADALLCPSQYLANQAEAHYGLTKKSIQVIPLPVGYIPKLEREKDTWEKGTILYVGRLERRKGIIEWIEAAVSVAHKYPEIKFEFIGANCLDTHGTSNEEFILRRIPKDLETRFHFWGEQKRSSLPSFLVKTRMAVIPSRWENFPNTCVETMCSGLPVIASREGGMAEMIEDGRTGWLTSKAGSDGLANALTRALETPPIKIAEMGNEASISIRKMCDNKKILENHLNFRNQIVHKGSRHSLHLPSNLLWNKISFSDKSERRNSNNNSQEGLAIVITCFNGGKYLDKCLDSLKKQTRKPLSVVIVDDGSTEIQTIDALNYAQQEGWQLIRKRNRRLASARNAGIEAILGSGLNPIGFAFFSVNVRVQPGFIAICESVLRRCSEVGLVSGWVQHPEIDSKIWIKPCPSFPYQWVSNEVAPFSVIRTEALREAGNFRSLISEGYEDWDLFNAAMVAGWIAVTIPEILAVHPFIGNSVTHLANGHAHIRMQKELLERFPDLIARNAKDILFLVESDKIWSLHKKNSRQWKQLTLARGRIILHHPLRTARRILKKIKNKIPWRVYPTLFFL